MNMINVVIFCDGIEYSILFREISRKISLKYLKK